MLQFVFYTVGRCLPAAFLLIVFGAGVSAAPSITYLGIEHGLSNNAVRCIYQDSYSYMWFGTYDGLNRYDGYGFKIFRNKIDDSLSLADGWINSINEDPEHHIWVGTRAGLDVLDRITLQFKHATYTPYGTGGTRAVRSTVNYIEKDAAGSMWVATSNEGLLLFKPGSSQGAQVPATINGKTVANYNVSAVRLHQGAIWFMINGVGLHRYNPATQLAVLVNAQLKLSGCMEPGQGSTLWIGNEDGLRRFDVHQKKYTQHITEGLNGLKDNRVAGLQMGHDGTLWIATDGGGVHMLNPLTQQFEYLAGGDGKNNVTSQAVYAVYQDNANRMWLGTLRGGINIIDPWKSRFRTIANDPLHSNSLVSNFVLSLCRDARGQLWIGTDGDGISVWNRQLNTFKHYGHQNGRQGSLSSNFVTNIVNDYQNNVWIATYGGGINQFNADGSFTVYPCINNSGVAARRAWMLFQDQGNRLWAGFVNDGLYCLNRAANRFELFDEQLANTLTMYQDRNRQVWLGNFLELVKANLNTKQYERIVVDRPVRAMHEDRFGNFWVGTEGGGLLLVNRHTNTFERFTTSHGLCNDAVLNILEDEKGYLWLSTFNGLSRFDPQRREFKNFYQGDGLQSNQFNYNAALKLGTGELAVGGIKGLNIFYPDSIDTKRYTPPLHLTDLWINNKPVGADTTYIRQKNGGRVMAIQMPYSEAAVTFAFAAMEYSAPEKIQYAYYLEGWDKRWNQAGNARTASYTHLREGAYTFRVKATNADGEWNADEMVVQVVVLPPWYRAWWAFLLYGGALAAAIYYYLLYRHRQTQLRYEVKLAHLNAEKEREINERKLSFFTDVSHEFRSPLSLIINPLKDIIERQELEEDKKELNIVYRNARRLLSLVDQLLLFRKADAGADRLKVAQVDLCSLTHDVYLSFQQQARLKAIDYRFFDGGGTPAVVFADREKIEIVLFNLLSNALKFTPQQGRVLVTVAATAHHVTVKVANSGAGIPESAGSQLFNKFYRAPAQEGSSAGGFGIGLHLSRQLVQQHGGHINYQSTPGEGVTFFFTLKKGADHLAHAEQLPAAPAETRVWNPVEEEPAIPPGENQLEQVVASLPTMLVADDDNQLLEYIAGIFETRFNVLTACNGVEALQMAKNHSPDMVITDISMAEMNGLELCHNIKGTPALSHIPVVLLTGSSSKETQLKGIELGADDYIVKPFEKELLVARVDNILKSRNVLKHYFFNEITLQENTLKVSAEYKVFIDSCIRIVEAHLDDDQFGIQTLAGEMGLSHSALYKKIKAVSGQSANGFIRFIRLRKAAELFINSNSNVNEVAYQVGINDIKYFRTQFNKLFGMNPSDYIKKFRKPFSSTYALSKKATRTKT